MEPPGGWVEDGGMPDNLARFERLARQAAERRARREDSDSKAEDEQRARDLAEDAQQALLSPEYLAGPPNGCRSCYVWRRHFKFGGWSWEHGEAIDPVTRPYPILEGYEDPPPCEWCTHRCHGADGYPLPVIVLAAC
jgi:hypothetical protein